jgi:predicted Zn-dependent peptidase
MNAAVRISRLAGGLTVASETMPRVETVSVGAYVAVGTRYEREEENGISHFLEHMAFKGTERRSAADIAREVEAVGGHINAYTAREQTAYYLKLLKEDLALGVDILGDILCHSVFLPEEIERERGVILQEIGQANDTPDDIVFDHFQETAFPGQPMGWPTLGREATIRALGRAQLRAYMEHHYAPARTVIAAAGAVDHDALVELVRRHFQDLPGRVAEAPLPARYQGGEFRESRDLDQVHIVLGFPGLPYGDPDYYAGLLLSTLLGGGMSSRLFQEVREKRGLVYSIYSFTQPYRDAGLFGIYAGTGEKELAELIPVTLAELRAVQRHIEAEELARARAQVKAGLLMSLESTGSRCEHIARHLQIYGRVIPVEEIIARIEAVSEADILRVAARLFRGTPTLATLGPVGAMPRLPEIAEKLAA